MYIHIDAPIPTENETLEWISDRSDLDDVTIDTFVNVVMALKTGETRELFHALARGEKLPKEFTEKFYGELINDGFYRDQIIEDRAGEVE